MKKVLMGTSALALVAATPASAVDWNVDVGGFMNMHVGYGNSDIDNSAPGTDVDGVDVLNNSEVIFRPSITLDNGISFGGEIQLEAQSAGDNIDETFAFVRGSFGEFNIGDENSAGYKMTYAAPNVTAMPINSGSASAFVPFSGAGGVIGQTNLFRNAKGSSFVEVGRNNDAGRITYYTPRFAGFQLGASYARDPFQDDNSQVDLNNMPLGNIWDVGANYVNSFGGIDVAVSGRYGSGTDDQGGATAINNVGGIITTDQGENPQVMAFGANIGYAGFTVGYAFAETNQDGVNDSQSNNAGISYETGPWGVSFTWFRGEGVDAENPYAVTGIGGGEANDEVYQAFILGGAYQLATGVGLTLYGSYIDTTEQTGDTGIVGAGDDISGFIIGSAIALSF